MNLPESDLFLTTFFHRENPPRLDREKRSGTLSLKEIRAFSEENKARFVGSRGQVALGLLMLWHDHWEEAHHIAQSDEGEPDHDLLHAIVHRREQDFANSSYWFREAGQNNSFKLIGSRADKLLVESSNPSAPQLRAEVLPDSHWSSQGFVTAIRADAREKENPTTSLLRELQAEEIISFFETLIS